MPQLPQPAVAAAPQSSSCLLYPMITTIGRCAPCRRLRLYDLPQDVATAAVLQHPDTLPPEEQAEAAEAAAGASTSGSSCSAAGGAGPDNLAPALRMHAGETVYDYCWWGDTINPHMHDSFARPSACPLLLSAPPHAPHPRHATRGRPCTGTRA